jgi:hypothetical protein
MPTKRFEYTVETVETFDKARCIEAQSAKEWFSGASQTRRGRNTLRPDVVIMGAGASRTEIYDYAGRLMRALNFPAFVFAHALG